MSYFRRTLSGLKNQHLFYNVDIVVFVEGGDKSFSKAEVLSGQYHEETEDIIYWKNVFSIFRTLEKIKFKSVGSKSTIKEIAMDIVNGKLSTVMVAMDNEFDEILNTRTIHPNILYTHGYSYENDVWNSIVIKAVVEELTAVEIDNTIIEETFEKSLKALKLAVYADGYQFKNGASFFPRKSGYLFCVNCVADNIPVIKKNEIEKKLIEKSISKSTVYSFGSKKKVDTHKYCFGHLLADFCCQIIMGYMKKQHDLIAPRKDILYRMGIKKYFQLCFDSGPIYTHHQTQLTKNGA